MPLGKSIPLLLFKRKDKLSDRNATSKHIQVENGYSNIYLCLYDVRLLVLQTDD